MDPVRPVAALIMRGKVIISHRRKTGVFAVVARTSCIWED